MQTGREKFDINRSGRSPYKSDTSNAKHAISNQMNANAVPPAVVAVIVVEVVVVVQIKI